jgi:hypothetical protein
LGCNASKTDIEIGLISDIKIMDIMERGKRGGLTFVGSKRYAKANNKYLPDYDKTKESSYLLYLDANNLYGHSMSEPLPYGGLEINTKITLKEVLETADDALTGYTIEVDLTFPEKIHELLKQYIPLPENIEPKTEWFSDYQKEVMEKTKSKSKCQKLVNHFFEHKNYGFTLSFIEICQGVRRRTRNCSQYNFIQAEAIS